MPAAATAMNPSRDDFAALLDESLATRGMIEGRVIPATVVAIENDFVVVDIGLKTEGRIPVREFLIEMDDVAPKPGDIVEVYLDRIENALGDAVVSREKARREEAWTRLEKNFAANEPVNGALVGRVKGGFTVDLGGANCVLAGQPSRYPPSARCGPPDEYRAAFRDPQMDRARGNNRRLAPRRA